MTCYIKLCAKIEGMDGLCLLVCVGINHEGVEEKFRKLTDGIFPTGLYLDLADKDGVWHKWLVINTADTSNNDFPTWSILPCGHKFQWVHDGKKCEMWGVERSQSS